MKVQQTNRFRPKFRIKKNDQVQVIAGDDKGKKGKVIEVDYSNSRVLIEGINIISKHTRPNAQYPNGGIIKKEAPIHISNVLVVNPANGLGARTGVKITGDKKERTFKATRRKK